MVATNQEIARLLHELAALAALEEGGVQAFRVRAYESAAHTIEGLEGTAAELSEAELVALRGVGKNIAAKIRELVETGSIAKLEELRDRFPPDYRELLRVPGLGPKTAELLRRELGVESLDDLRTAIEREALRDLPGLGAQTEDNLRRAIDGMEVAGKEHRTPIAEVLPLAEGVVDALRELSEVEEVRYAGSLRRFRDTIGDVDVLVAARRHQPVVDRFVALPPVKRVIARGDTKSTVLSDGGIQIDLRVVDPGQWGAALQYFTGSKAHNIRLRQLAMARGWTLSEYGLTEVESGKEVAAASEAEIYAALDLPYIPAPLREDVGELEAAERGELPALVQPGDLRGDLHVHTSLSGDGRDSLEDMVAAAARIGYAYLAISDHGENLRINGVTKRDLLRQRARIRRLQEEYPKLRLLQGAELNIGRDGGLDYDDEFLLSLDWAVASVHSHFGMDQSRQTKRVVRAIEHPAVNAIGHLTGRRIGKRAGIDLDLDTVFEASAATGTALEINSHLDRLDLPPELARRAAARGVRFVIDSDAHRVGELAQIRWGVRNAQRGWVTADRVVNTWPLRRFLRWAGAKKAG